MSSVGAALAVVGTVSLFVVLALAWRKWGRAGLAAASVGAVAVVAILARLFRRRPSPPPVAHIPPEVEDLLEEAERRQEEAERAREAAVRIEADIDAAGDAEALVAHLVSRSKGET